MLSFSFGCEHFDHHVMSLASYLRTPRQLARLVSKLLDVCHAQPSERVEDAFGGAVKKLLSVQLVPQEHPNENRFWLNDGGR